MLYTLAFRRRVLRWRFFMLKLGLCFNRAMGIVVSMWAMEMVMMGITMYMVTLIEW